MSKASTSGLDPEGEADRESTPLNVGSFVVPVIATVALISAGIALTFGNVPGEYMADLPGTTATILFIFAALIGWVGFIQNGGRYKLALDLQRLRPTRQR